MAETIANWAVKLSADASGLVQGLEASANRMRGFVSQTTTITKTLASGMNSALAGITRINIGQQAGGLGSLASSVLGIGAAFATGGIAAGVAALGSGAAAVVGLASRSMDAIAAQERLGRQIGLTAQQAAGLQELGARVGIGDDAMKEGLDKYARHLGQLRHELQTGSAGPITEALHQMGIDAREFASLPISEQFARLKENTDSLSAMEREASLFQVLGRGGMQLAGLIRQPANELRNLDEIARRSGYSISQAEAVMVGTTMRELKAIGSHVNAMFSNLTQGAAVALAPIARFFGNMIGEILDKGQPLLKLAGSLTLVWGGLVYTPFVAGIGAVVVSARVAVGVFEYFKPLVEVTWTQLERLGQSAKQTWDAFIPVLRAGWEVISGTVSDLWSMLPGLPITFESVGKAVTELGSLLESEVRKIGAFFASLVQRVASGAAELTSTIQVMMVAADTAIGGTGDTAQIRALADAYERLLRLRNAAAVAQMNLQLPTANPMQQAPAAAQEFLQTTQGLTSDFLSNIQRGVNTMLLGAREAQAVQFMMSREFQNAGMIERTLMLERLARLQREQEKAQEILRLRQSAERLVEQTRTPLEAFQNGMADLQAMWMVAGLDSETFGRQAARLFADLEKSDRNSDRSPAAVLAGTVQEQAAIVASQRQERDMDRNPQERIARAIERAEQLAIINRQQNDEIVEALQQIMFERVGD